MTTELAADDADGDYQEPVAAQGQPAIVRSALSGDGVDYFNTLSTEGTPLPWRSRLHCTTVCTTLHVT